MAGAGADKVRRGGARRPDYNENQSDVSISNAKARHRNRSSSALPVNLDQASRYRNPRNIYGGEQEVSPEPIEEQRQPRQRQKLAVN